MLDRLRPAILAAFTSAATEVLTREREAHRRGATTMSEYPKLEMVSVVTTEHGETFAEEWFDGSLDSGLLYDACQAAKIVEWPKNDDDAQERHHKITDEICKRTFEAAKDAIADAFVRVATAVLAREKPSPLISGNDVQK